MWKRGVINSQLTIWSVRSTHTALYPGPCKDSEKGLDTFAASSPVCAKSAVLILGSYVPRPSHPSVCHLQGVLQVTNAGVRRCLILAMYICLLRLW